MAKNFALQEAAARQDEFYTSRSDIEHEMRYYREHFEGKTVLCNCDDPYESEFFKYFALFFNTIGLKKLIATCYAGSPIAQRQLSLFDDETPAPSRKPYCAVIECMKDYNGGGRKFMVPDYYDRSENFTYDEQGRKWIDTPGPRWFTNLEHHRHNETMILVRRYHNDPSKFPHYDNYDAIEVSKTVEIPGDYDGVMGVPITFLDKYNPKQFEILGITEKDSPLSTGNGKTDRPIHQWQKNLCANINPKDSGLHIGEESSL